MVYMQTTWDRFNRESVGTAPHWQFQKEKADARQNQTSVESRSRPGCTSDYSRGQRTSARQRRKPGSGASELESVWGVICGVDRAMVAMGACNSGRSQSLLRYYR